MTHLDLQCLIFAVYFHPSLYRFHLRGGDFYKLRLRLRGKFGVCSPFRLQTFNNRMSREVTRISFFLVLQKARLARIRIAKASSGAAFVSKKKAAEARLAAQQSGLQLEDYKEEDIFELQHHHLLRCLEKTTVSSPRGISCVLCTACRPLPRRVGILVLFGPCLLVPCSKALQIPAINLLSCTEGRTVLNISF